MQLWKVGSALCLIALLAACGPEGSGYAPATNAITAVPEDVIDVRPDDYEPYALPESVPTRGLIASYGTGDSSGGRTLTVAGFSPAVADAASSLQEAADAVVRANEADSGNSTTIANETDDSEAEEAETGGSEEVETTDEETGGAKTENDDELAEDLDGEVETGGSSPSETGGAETGDETGGD